MILRPRYRQGTCYELAYRYVTIDERFVGWPVVRGTIISPIGDGEPVGHAWLWKDGKIHVFNKRFEAGRYKQKYQAKGVASYSAEEAMQAANGLGGTTAPGMRPVGRHSDTDDGQNRCKTASQATVDDSCHPAGSF